MTTRTSETSHLIYARVAGFTFLFYIAAGITSLALSGRPQVTDVLALLTSLSALVLGVTLYMITREQGPALALLALTCRVLEAVSGEAAIFFAVGSTLFSWLLLRGRLIPAALAWLGVLASVLLVVILPPATRGAVRRPYKLVGIDHLARVVANVGVRSDARAVADHQGSRDAHT